MIPLALRLEGSLDRGALQGALDDVVERHESLRTIFPETLGVPRQEILSGAAGRVALVVEAVGEAALAGGAVGGGRARV